MERENSSVVCSSGSFGREFIRVVDSHVVLLLCCSISQSVNDAVILLFSYHGVI